MTVSEIDSRQKIYPLEYEKFSPRHSRRWFIVLFAGLIMFGNHYARDALGALEIQIETDSVVSVDQYATINSIYFFPSIVAPLFAGIFSEYLGGAKKCLLYSVISSSVGHIIFSLGMQLDDIRLIYTGRSLAGFMYEIIDSMPLVIVGPLFSSQWGLVVGLLNGFLRLGSVVNFIMSPIIYKLKGIKVALWFATAAATCTILFAFLICICSDMDQRESSNSNVYNQLDVFKDSEADDIDSGPVIEAPVKALQNIGEQTIVILERVQYKSDPLVPLSGMDEKNAIVDNGYGNIMNQSPSISFDSPQHISYENISGDSKTVIDANVGDQGDAMPGLDDYSVHVDEENLIRRKTSPASVNFSIATCCHKIAEAMPLHMFGYQYYMFLCTGAFLYGAMVPFWFLGSKFLQDSYSLSVSHADALMLFPEGMIAVVSVPTGLLLDRHDVSTNVRLRMLSASCALLPVSYCLLANGFHVDKALLSNRSQPFGSSIEESYHHDSNLIYVSPTVTMCIIGVAYAVSNSLYWSTIMAILPKGPHLSPSNGLIASCLNILPSVVPPILVYVTAYGNLGKDFLLVFPMYLLSGLGCCAAGFSLVASFCKNTQPFPPNIEIGDNGS